MGGRAFVASQGQPSGVPRPPASVPSPFFASKMQAQPLYSFLGLPWPDPTDPGARHNINVLSDGSGDRKSEIKCRRDWFLWETECSESFHQRLDLPAVPWHL